MTSQTDRAEAMERVRPHLPPGTTAYTILRHRSSSGMSRAISVVTIEHDDQRGPWIADLGYNVSTALGLPYSERYEAPTVRGSGMDMGFWLVYKLSSALYPDGFTCTGDRCESNAHSNGAPHPHGFPPTTWDRRAQADRPTAPTEPCPVYRCGRPVAEHPTQPEHHRDGGYALKHSWI